MSANHLPDRTTLFAVAAPENYGGPMGDVIQASRLLDAVSGRFARLDGHAWLTTANQLHEVLDRAQKRSTRQLLVVVK